MPSTLVTHWRNLKGSIHPSDESAFAMHSHSFNLDYPPPAYVGDIERASVVLLNANGGFDPMITPAEFREPGSRERYIDLIHNPRPIDPGIVAPYYAKRNFSAMIADGRMALVNAVAYRSRRLSEEPENERLAEMLPSTAVHRSWLQNEIIPQANRGERLVIAHRYGKWKLRRSDSDTRNLIFTKVPVSANLPIWVIDLIGEWLATR